ncbi:MAG: hypothetical protein CMJ58_06345 [Planctomycetaceae bacterium]|jgi:hypothetical protein|nr:hypothetical protein [Planctomycetaceae bacterium]
MSAGPSVRFQSVLARDRGAGRGDNGAWRYPGFVIQRAPATRLGDSDYYDPRNPNLPRRRVESNFHILFNTLKSVSFLERQKMMEILAETLQIMKDPGFPDDPNPNGIAQFVRFGGKAARGFDATHASSYRGDKFHDVVQDVDWAQSVEIGEQQNRLHAHVDLRFIHYSQIQIDIPKINQIFVRTFNRILRREFLHFPALASKYTLTKAFIHLGNNRNSVEAESNWDLIRRQYGQKATASTASPVKMET